MRLIAKPVRVPSSIQVTPAFAALVHSSDFLGVSFAEALSLTELYSGVILEDSTNEIQNATELFLHRQCTQTRLA